MTQLTLNKKETIALLAAVICGSVTNPSDPTYYIFTSRGKGKKTWIDTILSSLSTRIDGLTPHFDRDGNLVPGAFWVSKAISDWADSYDRSSQAYKEFDELASRCSVNSY